MFTLPRTIPCRPKCPLSVRLDACRSCAVCCADIEVPYWLRRHETRYQGHASCQVGSTATTWSVIPPGCVEKKSQGLAPAIHSVRRGRRPADMAKARSLDLRVRVLAAVFAERAARVGRWRRQAGMRGDPRPGAPGGDRRSSLDDVRRASRRSSACLQTPPTSPSAALRRSLAGCGLGFGTIRRVPARHGMTAPHDDAQLAALSRAGARETNARQFLRPDVRQLSRIRRRHPSRSWPVLQF